MPALRELQAGFARVVLGGSPAGLLEAVVADRLSPSRRLAVYRNNVHIALLRVLEGGFPSTRRAAGEQGFRAAALAFLRAAPPAEPCLHRWGGEFPTWLAEHPATATRPWLVDLARFEWAREEVYYAADAPVLTPAVLAGVPHERYPTLRLHLHPTARLLASPWPIHALWRGDAALPPRPTPAQLLVSRPGMEVLTLPLTPGEHALLAALAAASPLADAAEVALDAEPGLDLMAVLARHLASGTFTAFT